MVENLDSSKHDQSDLVGGVDEDVLCDVGVQRKVLSQSCSCASS